MKLTCGCLQRQSKYRCLLALLACVNMATYWGWCFPSSCNYVVYPTCQRCWYNESYRCFSDKLGAHTASAPSADPANIAISHPSCKDTLLLWQLLFVASWSFFPLANGAAWQVLGMLFVLLVSATSHVARKGASAATLTLCFQISSLPTAHR